MSHTTTLRVPPLGAIALDRAARDVLAALIRRTAAWLRRQQQLADARATRAALAALDDRTLHDIGLDRSEIASVTASFHTGNRDRRR